MYGKRPFVAITMGDAAGIGPELCLRVLREPRVLEACVPVVFADASVLRKVADRLSLPVAAPVISKSNRSGWATQSSPLVVDLGLLDGGDVEPGRVKAAYGRASASYVEAGVKAALEGRVDALVTGPINKEAWRLAGVPFASHTDMLASLTETSRYCMMLWSDRLTVSMVTAHVGLAEVPQQVTQSRVLEVIELTAQAVGRIEDTKARIGVLGLNPHRGEGGLFGHREEERLIEPAIELARKKGIDARGPLPPDTAFLAESRKGFDAMVCMYHDQGHIPFKMLAFDTGVNLTLGLPIVRTSVAHGTAFDIAWKGRASPDSLISSIILARRLVGARRREKLSA